MPRHSLVEKKKKTVFAINDARMTGFLNAKAELLPHIIYKN